MYWEGKRAMGFIETKTSRRRKRILLYVLVSLVVTSFLMTIVIPFWAG